MYLDNNILDKIFQCLKEKYSLKKNVFYDDTTIISITFKIVDKKLHLILKKKNNETDTLDFEGNNQVLFDILKYFQSDEITLLHFQNKILMEKDMYLNYLENFLEYILKNNFLHFDIDILNKIQECLRVSYSYDGNIITDFRNIKKIKFKIVHKRLRMFFYDDSVQENIIEFQGDCYLLKILNKYGKKELILSDPKNNDIQEFENFNYLENLLMNIFKKKMEEDTSNFEKQLTDDIDKIHKTMIFLFFHLDDEPPESVRHSTLDAESCELFSTFLINRYLNTEKKKLPTDIWDRFKQGKHSMKETREGNLLKRMKYHDDEIFGGFIKKTERQGNTETRLYGCFNKDFLLDGYGYVYRYDEERNEKKTYCGYFENGKIKFGQIELEDGFKTEEKKGEFDENENLKGLGSLKENFSNSNNNTNPKTLKKKTGSAVGLLLRRLSGTFSNFKKQKSYNKSFGLFKKNELDGYGYKTIWDFGHVSSIGKFKKNKLNGIGIKETQDDSTDDVEVEAGIFKKDKLEIY